MAQNIRTRKNLILKVIDSGCYYDERIMVHFWMNPTGQMIIDMDMLIGQDRIKTMNQTSFCNWEEFLNGNRGALPEFNYWNKI